MIPQIKQLEKRNKINREKKYNNQKKIKYKYEFLDEIRPQSVTKA